MRSIKEILKEKKQGPYFAKYEWQAYGIFLAETLSDLKHKSLYIKLAKEEPRERLEKALEFVKVSRPKNKAKLFMWKLAQLRKG